MSPPHATSDHRKALARCIGLGGALLPLFALLDVFMARTRFLMNPVKVSLLIAAIDSRPSTATHSQWLSTK